MRLGELHRVKGDKSHSALVHTFEHRLHRFVLDLSMTLVPPPHQEFAATSKCQRQSTIARCRLLATSRGLETTPSAITIGGYQPEEWDDPYRFFRW